jgi:ketosteroid isomerase-like protein
MRAVLFVAVVAIALPTSALALDKAEFQKLQDQFMAAFNKGDAKGATSTYYADDAVVLPPGADMVKGKANIESFWAKASEMLGDVRGTTVDVQPLGNSAVREIGTFAGKTKGPTPQDVKGKYVVIWEKTGSDWRASIDIWNASE